MINSAGLAASFNLLDCWCFPIIGWWTFFRMNGCRGNAHPRGNQQKSHHAVSPNSSRPMSQRRISLVPAPIS